MFLSGDLPPADFATSTPPPPRARLRLALPMCLAPLIGFALLRPDGNRKPPVFDGIDTGALHEIRSQRGLLQATLRAAPQTVTIGPAAFPGASYNGLYAGPLLRVQPGDRVRLRLINAMPDDINLHFHGLRVPPEGRADNVHIRVKPGRFFDYDFVIPIDHPPGLFWFHDHAHGSAEPHVMQGLAGTLLVEGFASQFPGLGDIAQKLLVLKDWGIPGCAGAVLNTELHCRVISINGEPAWHDTMPAMGSQLWRISNEGANLTLHLAAPGLHFRVIGRDGTPALDGQTPQTLDIMPASRLDVLVTAATQGAITLMATGVPTGGPGHFSTSRPFGTIAVTPARATAGTAHVTLPREPDLRGVAVDRQRLIIFGENAAATIFTINGQSYSPANQPFRVPLGSTEAWTIRNDTQDFHVFHIHQLGFQVLEINGRPQAFTGYVDGVRVPETGEVKLLMPFTSKLILGHIMFHCHVLKHEDAGMMAELELFRPGGFKICRTPTPPNHPPQ